MREKHSSAAWKAAVELEHDLAVGILHNAITPPPDLPLADGERVLAEFRAPGAPLRYERFSGADVGYHTGGGVAIGSTAFVAGYVLMGVARNAHARRQAKAMAAPQWRVSDLAGVVVTTQRLWCDLAIGKRLNFNYEEITGFQLDRWSLMLRFRSATPLLVTGAWAPWIAVAVAYHAFGRDQARRLSGMAALRGPGSTAVRAAGTAAVRTSRRTRV